MANIIRGESYERMKRQTMVNKAIEEQERMAKQNRKDYKMSKWGKEMISAINKTPGKVPGSVLKELDKKGMLHKRKDVEKFKTNEGGIA